MYESRWDRRGGMFVSVSVFEVVYVFVFVFVFVFMDAWTHGPGVRKKMGPSWRNVCICNWNLNRLSHSHDDDCSDDNAVDLDDNVENYDDDDSDVEECLYLQLEPQQIIASYLIHTMTMMMMMTARMSMIVIFLKKMLQMTMMRVRNVCICNWSMNT